MSNLTGLPPAAIARAAAQSNTQAIAVRLITLADGLKDNPQALSLKGTVTGANPDGSVRVETERGPVDILLKDRGSLPAGQKIEIDIPAGRPPQTASIRPPASIPNSPSAPPAPPASSPQPPPPLAAYLASAGVRLDRETSIRSGDIAEALEAATLEVAGLPAAPLQAGQILRLLPSQTILLPGGTGASPAILNPRELFTALVNLVTQTIDLPQETRANLIRILSIVDPSSLVPPGDTTVQPVSEETVQTAFQKLSQALVIPSTNELQDASSRIVPALPAVPDPGKPLDVKIFAFQAAVETVDFASLLTPAGKGAAQATGPLMAASIVATAPAQIAEVAEQAAPVALLGQVTGFTPSGQPLLSLALPGSGAVQQYAMQFAAGNIAEGSFVLVGPLPARQALSAGTDFIPFALGAGQNIADWAQEPLWSSLQSLIAAAGHLDPALAQTVTRMLPSPAQPQNMPALSLFFLSVMRSGDLDSWIDEGSVAALKAGGKLDVLRALTGDTAQAARFENLVLPNDWRAAMLPFWAQGQIAKLPLYYKQWDDETASDEKERRKKITRFLFELKLSRMGSVQVDGFMKRQTLDMILRTKSIVSANMQSALKLTYAKTMERSNLSGEITFQFKPEQWVNMDLNAMAVT